MTEGSVLAATAKATSISPLVNDSQDSDISPSARRQCCMAHDTGNPESNQPVSTDSLRILQSCFADQMITLCSSSLQAPSDPSAQICLHYRYRYCLSTKDKGSRVGLAAATIPKPSAPSHHLASLASDLSSGVNVQNTFLDLTTTTTTE